MKSKTMIFDNEAATELVLQIKERNAQIASFSKQRDQAPHILQELHGEFYDHCQPFLRSAVREFAKGANIQDHEDLAQDAFLKILRMIDRYSPKKGRLHNWMTKITRNLCWDWLRKKKPQLLAEGLPKDTLSIELKLDGEYNFPLNFDRKPSPENLIEDRKKVDNYLDKEDYDIIKDSFPFYVSDRLMFDLLTTVERHRFTACPACVEDVLALLEEEEIDYTEYGKPVEMVNATIILLRGLLMRVINRADIIKMALIKNPEFNELRVLTRFLGLETTEKLILLLGGLRIQLPAPRQFYRD